MTTLVVGATGATGRLLVQQLLDRGHHVKVIVRSRNKLAEVLKDNDQLSVIHANILDLSDAEIAQHVNGCSAVASCLGHELTLKGIYGQPRRLVTDAIRRLCDSIKANKPEKPIKVVLMNTAGNSDRNLHEPVSLAERFVIGLLRLILPPHVDNEHAADYLRTEIGQRSGVIEWVAVRPDTLTNANTVTEYEVHASPTRSALFNPGKTSRMNVAHFMVELITDQQTWNRWKGQMPVVYNRVSS